MGTFDRAQFTFQFLRKDSLGWSVENDNLHILPPWNFLSFSAISHIFQASACACVRVRNRERQEHRRSFGSGPQRALKKHPYRQNYSYVILTDLIFLPDPTETPVWCKRPITLQYTCRRRARARINYLTTQRLWGRERGIFLQKRTEFTNWSISVMEKHMLHFMTERFTAL